VDATLTISAEWSSQLFKTTTTSKSLFAANNQVCCAKAESSVGRRFASFLAGTATTGRNKKVLQSIRNKTERSQMFRRDQQRMLRGVPADIHDVEQNFLLLDVWPFVGFRADH
jgi:hypothetical protein